MKRKTYLDNTHSIGPYRFAIWDGAWQILWFTFIACAFAFAFYVGRKTGEVRAERRASERDAAAITRTGFEWRTNRGK